MITCRSPGASSSSAFSIESLHSIFVTIVPHQKSVNLKRKDKLLMKRTWLFSSSFDENGKQHPPRQCKHLLQAFFQLNICKDAIHKHVVQH